MAGHVHGQPGDLGFCPVTRRVVKHLQVWAHGVTQVLNQGLGVIGKLSCTGLDSRYCSWAMPMNIWGTCSGFAQTMASSSSINGSLSDLEPTALPHLHPHPHPPIGFPRRRRNRLPPYRGCRLRSDQRCLPGTLRGQRLG